MQPIMKIYLNLNNPIPAFSFKEDHLSELRSVFPALEVVAVDSTDDLAARLDDADFVATWEFPSDLYAKAPRLKAVFTPAAGKERVAEDPSGNVPTHYGTFHGMLMAESLLAMMLYFNRRLDLMTANKEQRRWSHEGLSESRSLSVQRVLVVGYGNIGRTCARYLSAFGCSVTGVRRSPEASPSGHSARRVVPFTEMPSHLEKADHVVLILPGSDETKGIFTRDHFVRMKRGAHLYNLGRGTCYREEDLLWALESGQIAGAGLDVFAEEPLPRDSRLWTAPNAFIMPHASAIYDDYMDLFLAELMGRLQSLVEG